jgi:hypothetical protein
MANLALALPTYVLSAKAASIVNESFWQGRSQVVALLIFALVADQRSGSSIQTGQHLAGPTTARQSPRACNICIEADAYMA